MFTLELHSSIYLRLIKDLAQLSPEDKAIITEANRRSVERELSSHSAAKGGADHFLDVVGNETQRRLLSFAMRAADIHSPTFIEGLEDLRLRMTEGHDLSISETQLVDGASVAVDHAIHGHTSGAQHGIT